MKNRDLDTEVPEDGYDLLAAYQNKFGATFAMALLGKVGEDTQKEIEFEMKRALAGLRKKVTDKDIIGDLANNINIDY